MNRHWWHRCGPACAAADGTAAISGSRQGRTCSRVIDIHCHTISVTTEKLVAGHPGKQAEMDLMARQQGAESMAYNRAVMLPHTTPKMASVARRLSDMDAMGVDIQAVSASPTQYYYWAEQDLAEEIVRQVNDDLAALCAEQPDRMVGLASVALQFPERAAAQLEHAVRKLGMRGAIISTSVNSDELSARHFDPFWAKAEELGVVIFIHPFGSSLMERLDRFYLANIIGQPIETTIALSHLIFGGVLDRHRGLKVVAAHGGGYLPFYPGRGDHAYGARTDSRSMEKQPGAYLGQIFYDTVVHDPAMLRSLAERVGVDQILLGTDYPFDMGDYRTSAFVSAAITDPQARAAILGGTAARLLGLGSA